MQQGAIKSEAKTVFEQLSVFSDSFYLAGGTALALQLGHRVSVDFDLFTYRKSDKLSQNIVQRVKENFSDRNVIVELVESHQINILVDKIQVTFLAYPFTPLFDLVQNSLPIKLLSVRDIAADKAHTIGRRATLKDYVDLFFLIKEGHITIKKLADLASKKFSKQEFGKKLFLQQLVYLNDIEEEHIEFLRNTVTKTEIEKFFHAQIKKEHLLE